ncbi:MAG: DNA repair protein RecO [Saprospirales bacterium]|nr:DNA repair protein RecO [Saprospirales bacterium]
MVVKTRGIVFRNQKYGETSVILDVFTEEKGLQSYMVHGVRKAKARVPASLVQVMSLVDLVSDSRDDKSLHHIKEIRPAWVYHSIPFDLKKGAIGLFMIEMARKSIREIEENRPLFEFIYHSFLLLDQVSQGVSNFHLRFLCELSVFLGFHPDGEASADTPLFDLKEGMFVSIPPPHPYFLHEDHALLLDRLLRSSYESLHTVILAREERKALLHHLMDYYRLHIENFPPVHSYQVLEAVLLPLEA